MREIVDAFLASSRDSLARMGWDRTQFVKREDLQSFVKLSRTGMEHGLTIYPAVAEGAVAVYAHVGITHPRLSRLAGQFYQLPVASVFGASISDLLHQAGLDGNPYRRWAMRSRAEVDVVVARLCDDIATFAERYLATYSSIADLIEPLAHNKGPLAPGYLVLAYALTDRWPESIDALARYADQALSEPPLLAAQSWQFIHSFVARYAIPSDSLPFTLPPPQRSADKHT